MLVVGPALYEMIKKHVGKTGSLNGYQVVFPFDEENDLNNYKRRYRWVATRKNRMRKKRP